MAGNTSRELSDILAAYDFGALGVVVDVAGGRGTLLAGIRRNIRICGASCSTSRTSSPRPRPWCGRQRPRAAANSLAATFWPTCRSAPDAYLLKNTVIGMNDAEAAQVFHACRAAMGQRSRLLVVGELIGPALHPDRLPIWTCACW
jgi:hypothetical protein